MKKNISKFLCIFVSVMLGACATVRDVPEVPQIARVPPAEAVQVCPDLTAIKSAGFADVVRKLDEVSTLYYQCQHKHGELVEWVQRGKDHQ